MADLTQFYNPKILAELAVGYGNRRYIADLAMPTVRSADQIGTFQVFDKDNMALDIESARTSPTADVAALDFGVSKTDFTCKGYGFKHFVPNHKDEDVQGQYLAGAVQVVKDSLLNIREGIVLTKILACGNTTSITTAWDAASTDLGTVRTGVEQMQADLVDETGMPGNVLIMGRDVWAVVAGKVVGGYLTPTVPNTQMLAELLGVDRILVSEVDYVTEKNAGSWDNPTKFWTAKYAALLNNGVADMPNFDANMGSTAFTPAYGKTAQWTGGATMDGIEWRSYEWADKGSGGGVYVSGTMYIDAVETLNKAATLASVLT